MVSCDNCGLTVRVKELGKDIDGNSIVECKECGAVLYGDGEIVEGTIIIEDGIVRYIE